MGGDLNSIEHVAVEDAGRWYGAESECDYDLFTSRSIAAGKAKQVVQIRRAVIDIGKDRIYGIGVVMIGHGVSLLKNTRKTDRDLLCAPHIAV